MDTNFEITVTDEDGQTWTKGFNYSDLVKLRACYGMDGEGPWGVDIEVYLNGNVGTWGMPKEFQWSEESDE